MNNDMKQVKFEILIDDVIKGLDSLLIGSFSRMAESWANIKCTGTKINPLELVFDKENINEYGKIILSKTEFKVTEWSNEYRDKDLTNPLIKVRAIKELVIRLRESKRQSIELIFWSLFISAVDREDYEERISTISDLAHLINIDDDIIIDLIQVIKNVLGQGSIGYDYKTSEVSAIANILSGIS